MNSAKGAKSSCPLQFGTLALFAGHSVLGGTLDRGTLGHVALLNSGNSATRQNEECQP